MPITQVPKLGSVGVIYDQPAEELPVSADQKGRLAQSLRDAERKKKTDAVEALAAAIVNRSAQ